MCGPEEGRLGSQLGPEEGRLVSKSQLGPEEGRWCLNKVKITGGFEGLSASEPACDSDEVGGGVEGVGGAVQVAAPAEAASPAGPLRRLARLLRPALRQVILLYKQDVHKLRMSFDFHFHIIMKLKLKW